MCDQEFEFFLHGCVIFRGAGEVKFSVIRNLQEKRLCINKDTGKRLRLKPEQSVSQLCPRWFFITLSLTLSSMSCRVSW